MLLSQLKGCSECTFLGAPCAPSPGKGHLVLSLLATSQVTNPGRSRWPWSCGSAPPVWLCSSLPASESDSETSNFSPCLFLIYISKFPEHTGVFPDGCLYGFFLFHFHRVDDGSDELK